MKITLKDIADHANVSISSVSRALNNANSTALVNDQTRLRIIQAAKDLGYHKFNNSLQKNENFSVNKKVPKRVGLALYDVKDKYQDPYFSEIIYGIESELLDQDCILDFTFEVQDIFNFNLFGDMNDSDLGVICIGPLKHDFINELNKRVPFVISVGGIPKLDIDYVTVDFRNAAMQAVQYLVDLGHRNIAYIGGSSQVGMPIDQEERFYGYKEAMESNHLDIVPEWVQDGCFDLTRSYEAMKKILNTQSLPSAVFTASDKMAFGAYKAIGEYGLSIPNDISVVSFDNVEMSEFINPPLTTVQVHKEEMGRIAVKLLLQRMEGGIPLPLISYLPTKLMVRSSCREKRSENYMNV